MPHGDFVLGYFHSVAVGEGHRVQVLTSALCLNREERKGHIHRSKVSLRDWGQGGRGHRAADAQPSSRCLGVSTLWALSS